jgi:glutamate-ammonia-ligase adenylyltransferase
VNRAPRIDFGDTERSISILARLASHGIDEEAILPALAKSPDPDRALANLERWLSAGTDSKARAVSLLDGISLRYRLCLMLGASQWMADIIIQNPELGLLLGDSEELARPVDKASLMGEAKALLANATSFTHRLDRLRYLRQITLLRITYNDLSGTWEPLSVWAALSELADAIVESAAHVVWAEMGRSEPLPVAVIALGKLGTGELNYSSDIDLMFIAADDADLETATKFCEKLTRSLEGRMGRGALYRVDLRLRPLGGAGPIVLRNEAAASYYQNYCEPWEVLAMIRSRTSAGDAALGEQFLGFLSTVVYRGARSDIFFEGLVSAKQRYEEEVRSRGESEVDIKLGPGGIRDAEFIVQALQLVVGASEPEVRGLGTVPAAQALAREGKLSQRGADTLCAAIVLLRQAEHRIQLRFGLQTHLLPCDPKEREVLASLMGTGSWSRLDSEIRRYRMQVRELLESKIPMLRRSEVRSHGAAQALGFLPGSPQAIAAEKLVGFSDAPDALVRQIAEDSSTAERLELISQYAPRVISDVSFHRELWDVAFSEEVELVPADEVDPGVTVAERIAEAGNEWESSLSAYLRREFVSTCIKEAFHGDVRRTFARLSRLAEAALLAALDAMGGEGIDIIALGRLGCSELVLPSDWDVMLLAGDGESHARAERIGQEWLRAARRISLNSGYFPIDLRLRPEGSAGLVVRTVAGFRTYASAAMETWERLAFTRARSLRAWEEIDAAITDAPFMRGEWGWDEETEILAMRDRIHGERMRAWEGARNVKLGAGFLLDVEWLAAMLRLRHPEAGIEPGPTHMVMAELAEVGILGRAEAQDLGAAALLFARIRDIMFLLEFDDDSVLPENPERLARIASALKLSGANEVLEIVETSRSKVMQTYQELILRRP